MGAGKWNRPNVSSCVLYEATKWRYEYHSTILSLTGFYFCFIYFTLFENSILFTVCTCFIDSVQFVVVYSKYFLGSYFVIPFMDIFYLNIT